MKSGHSLKRIRAIKIRKELKWKSEQQQPVVNAAGYSMEIQTRNTAPNVLNCGGKMLSAKELVRIVAELFWAVQEPNDVPLAEKLLERKIIKDTNAMVQKDHSEVLTNVRYVAKNTL